MFLTCTGENLADINGLNVAYRAFLKSSSTEAADEPPPNKVLAQELSNSQLFFVAFAQNYVSPSIRSCPRAIIGSTAIPND